MHLQSGTRLGAYEIVAPLGAGGMGEVYRARDTRLDRTVALKVLPERFGAKSELRERFEREARVVSNLNHPHICTLYDVGHDQGVAFFVMEYIEGQSLADRIARGPLPLDQALRIAIDVAGALAKAHRHGIVHRDLKPGNVMLTRSGAKLLDFGLARSATSSPVLMPDEATVAQAAPLTSEGTILGTLQYMSPEQLEGGSVDARSDLFAFGALLYEMVTGQRAFAAASHASLITKIMSEEPRPVREVQPVTPARLENVIKRCLAKDPDARWQCAGDLVTELRAIASGDVAATATAPAKRSMLPWIAAAVLLAATVVLAYLLARKPATGAQPLRFEVTSPTADSNFDFDALSCPIAVSPDGRRIVFVNMQSGQRTLWMRSLDAAAPAVLEGTTSAIGPFWSPDGASIAFFAAGKLQAMDVATHAIRTICNVSSGAAAGSWSAGGTIVFAELARDGGLYMVPAGGGTPKKLPGEKGLFGYHFPQFLGDGKHFLFSGLDAASPALYAASIDGMAPRRLQSGFSHVSWVPPYLISFRDGSLFAQKFDEKELKLEGPAIPLGLDAQAYWPTGSSAHAAAGGTLVSIPWASPRSLRWLDRNGREVMAGPDGEYYQLRVSPDGRRIAATMTDHNTGVGALWTVDVARKALTRASFDKIDHDSPVWSPDGRQVVFTSDVDGPPHLYLHDFATGKAEMLLPPSEIQFPTSWSADGRIFYEEVRLDTRGDIMVMSLAGRKPQVWLSTPFDEGNCMLSPDRRWLVYTSDASGARELYAAGVDAPRDAVRLTTGGGRRVRWSRDGREIYFLRGPRDVYALEMKVEGGSIAVAEPQHLFTTTSDIQDYDVDPSGRFVVAQMNRSATNLPMTVVVNWQSLIEKK